MFLINSLGFDLFAHQAEHHTTFSARHDGKVIQACPFIISAGLLKALACLLMIAAQIGQTGLFLTDITDSSGIFNGSGQLPECFDVLTRQRLIGLQLLVYRCFVQVDFSFRATRSFNHVI